MRLILLALIVVAGASAKPLEKYLPADVTYRDDVLKPAAVFGFEPGDRHLRHDQLAAYMRQLAATSDRVEVQTIGRTYELREQQLVAISHPDNLARLETLRSQHLDFVEGRRDEPGPLIVWLGYSIHGNEASGSNAAPLVAYHLAAAEGIEDWLRETIVLIDPSLNPDGMGRFAHWANTNRSEHPVADPQNREHNEYWPGGRFNHYWADLNRDWLLLTHRESRHRVAVFQRWRPHVFGDFHEMGSNATYFFQPGVEVRQNPLTAPENLDFTRRIAAFHARALDARGELYYSGEVFDDYYYGKGSTYPDIQGSVGILFEQASVRAHRRETDYRTMTFSDAVHNHFSTSLSTLEGATEMAPELKAWQARFVREGLERGRKSRFAGYIFGDSADPTRGQAMAEILRTHGIEVRSLEQTVTVDGVRFVPGSAFIAPTAQRQFPLLEAVFETRTEFADTTFYDVSTWTFPLAFDLPYGQLKSLDGAAETLEPAATAEVAPPAYGHAIDWRHGKAAAALALLHRNKIKVRAATRSLQAGERDYGRGTLFATGLDESVLKELAAIGVPVDALQTGLTAEGPDLGSPSLPIVDPITVAMITGPGVNPRAAGDIWMLLDQVLAMPPTMIDSAALAGARLGKYSHVLMVDGNYERLGEMGAMALRRFVEGGGTLLASQGAAAWVTNQKLHQVLPQGEVEALDAASPEEMEKEPAQPLPYGNYDEDFSQTVVGGAILAATIDTTHPLGYGYDRERVHVMKGDEHAFDVSTNPYQTPLRYSTEPLISGYLGEKRAQQLAGSAAALVDHVGGGRVIRLADNLHFRGYWQGTRKLLYNALFFSQLIRPTPVPDTSTRL